MTTRTPIKSDTVTKERPTSLNLMPKNLFPLPDNKEKIALGAKKRSSSPFDEGIGTLAENKSEEGAECLSLILSPKQIGENTALGAKEKVPSPDATERSESTSMKEPRPLARSTTFDVGSTFAFKANPLGNNEDRKFPTNQDSFGFPIGTDNRKVPSLSFVNTRRGSGADKEERLRKQVEELVKNHLSSRPDNGNRKQEHEELLKGVERILTQHDTQRSQATLSEPVSSELKTFLSSLFVFNGNAVNLQRFLFIGDCAYDACNSEAEERLLLKQMLVHLDGITYNRVALHKTFEGYTELRQELIKMCGTTRTVNQIQDEINTLNQGSTSLIDYGNKATQLLAELQTSAYSQYGRKVAEVNKGLYDEGVARAYTRGLPEGLRILVASGQPRELRDAIRNAEAFQEGGFVSRPWQGGYPNQKVGNQQRKAENTSFRRDYQEPNKASTSGYNRFQEGNNFRDNAQRGNFPQNTNGFSKGPQQQAQPNARKVAFDSRPPRRINMLRTEFARRIYIKLQTSVQKEPLLLLVDTGSDVSILNRRIVTEVIDQTPEKVVYGCTNFQTTGKVNVLINVPGHSISQPFLVASENSLPRSGLLGLDFLETYGAIIDTKNCQLTFDWQGVKVKWPLVYEIDGHKNEQNVIKSDSAPLNEEPTPIINDHASIREDSPLTIDDSDPAIEVSLPEVSDPVSDTEDSPDGVYAELTDSEDDETWMSRDQVPLSYSPASSIYSRPELEDFHPQFDEDFMDHYLERCPTDDYSVNNLLHSYEDVM